MIPVSYNQRLLGYKPSKRLGNLGFITSRLAGFVLLASLALLYIAQSSQGAAKRIEVQSLRTQAENLVTQEDQLRLEALRLQSLDTISQAIDPLGLQAVTDVEDSRP